MHAMHSFSCGGPRQIAPCTMHRQSTLELYIVLLTRSLAHCSCSWPTQLDQAVVAASVHMLVVAYCKCKIEVVSII